MKKIIALSALIVAGAVSPVMAANLAVIATPPAISSFLVLCIAVGCAVGSFKVMGLVKGGHLFKSWQIFLLSFGGLALAQLTTLMHDLELGSMPGFVGPLLFVAAAGLLLYGIYITIRTLE